MPNSYFGPPPSEIDCQPVGPVQLLRSGKLDRKRGTIRIPLYLGHMHIHNAPVVVFDKGAAQIRACRGNVDHSLVHDRVVRICPNGDGGGTVTIKLITIFSFGRPAQYMSMEASDRMVATLDRGTFAPALDDLPLGGDDGAFSAIERLFVMINGPTGKDNPQRQGLNSALLDKRDPLHVIGGIPTLALDYSPMWDGSVGIRVNCPIAHRFL